MQPVRPPLAAPLLGSIVALPAAPVSAQQRPNVVAGDVYWVDAAVIERQRPGRTEDAP